MIGDEWVFQLADIRFSLDPEGNVLAFPCELGRCQIRQIELAKRDNITWNDDAGIARRGQSTLANATQCNCDHVMLAGDACDL